MAHNLQEAIEMARMKVDKKGIEIGREYEAFRQRMVQKQNRPLPKTLNRRPLSEPTRRQTEPWKMAMDGQKAHFESEEKRTEADFAAAEKKIHKTKARLDRQFEAWQSAVKQEGKQIL